MKEGNGWFNFTKQVIVAIIVILVMFGWVIASSNNTHVHSGTVIDKKIHDGIKGRVDYMLLVSGADAVTGELCTKWVCCGHTQYESLAVGDSYVDEH